MKRFIRDYSDAALLDAAIVLSQPAVPHPTAAARDSLVHRPAEHRQPAGRHGERDRLEGGGDARRATRARSRTCSGSRCRPAWGSRGRWSRRACPPYASRPTASCRSIPPRTSRTQFSTDTFVRFGRAALSLILVAGFVPGRRWSMAPTATSGWPGTCCRDGRSRCWRSRCFSRSGWPPGSGLASGARQPDRSGAGHPLDRAAGGAVLRLPACASRRRAGRPAAQPRIPLRSAARVPRGRGHDLGGGGGLLGYGAIAFFIRPLRPPPPAAVASAPSAAPRRSWSPAWPPLASGP